MENDSPIHKKTLSRRNNNLVFSWICPFSPDWMITRACSKVSLRTFPISFSIVSTNPIWPIWIRPITLGRSTWNPKQYHYWISKSSQRIHERIRKKPYLRNNTFTNYRGRRGKKGAQGGLKLSTDHIINKFGNLGQLSVKVTQRSYLTTLVAGINVVYGKKRLAGIGD